MVNYFSVLKETAINLLKLVPVEIDTGALNTMGAEEEFSAFTNAEEHILRQILLLITNERAIIIPLLDTV